MSPLVIITSIILAAASHSISANTVEDNNTCKNRTSCYSCLSKGSCVWCVNKSKCSPDSCGNDNIIYPSSVRALMAGSQFCPRVVLPEDTLYIESGKLESVDVKITQIYMYMAFTPWKCKISLEGKEVLANAMLLSDEVYCEPVILDTASSRANGSVSVLWERSKAFDGYLPITVCRCDLDSSCPACRQNN